MRIVPNLVTTVALVIGPIASAGAQGGSPSGSTTPPPAMASGAAGTILGLAVLAVIVIALVVVARGVTSRRKRLEEAVILQSQLSDALAREPRLHGLAITPRARVSGWGGARATIEIGGEVPTPELREAVMRLASAEVLRRRPDVTTTDHLFIVPPARRTSDSFAARG
jgi:hypothetical protein